MPTSINPHACDATPSHAYHLVSSCLKSNPITHCTNICYSSCVWCTAITRISSCQFLLEIQSVNLPCRHQFFLMRVIHPYHTPLPTRTRMTIILPTLIIYLTPYLFFGNLSNNISSNNTNANTTTTNINTARYSLYHEQYFVFPFFAAIRAHT